MNIIVNAAEAMNGSGTLTIATSVFPSRKSISVEFTDTGEGIPEENLTRIFDPFFTTKDIGKGTGLGLATSYGIIESHGGKITVRSKVGQGSTFTIELPVHPAKQTFLENRSVTNQGVKDEFKHADGSKGKPLSL
jgi:signal transduction histidine kinase